MNVGSRTWRSSRVLSGNVSSVPYLNTVLDGPPWPGLNVLFETTIPICFFLLRHCSAIISDGSLAQSFEACPYDIGR